MKKCIIVVLAIATVIVSFGQDAAAVKEYIASYKELAISEMQRTGIPAAIKLAQGIHESGAGKSELALKSNNHFGIKCKTGWSGEKVYHDDDERGECFRKYESCRESYIDHSNFLKNNQRYAFLFELNPEDYAAWANGLKKAGYATNPKYSIALIKIIEAYNLEQYTLKGMAEENPPSPIEELRPVEEEKILQVAPVPVETKPTLVAAYPSGVFKRNETKVVFVTNGTAYFSIAQQYNIPLKKLFDFNELPETEEAVNDQLVYLQPKRKTGNAIFHIIAPGESLRDIAQFQAMRLDALLTYNWLKAGEMPAVGEKLLLQEKSSTKPKLALRTNYSLSVNIN